MTRILEKYFPALVLMSLLLPLLVMGYLGQYSRLIADDYCWAAKVHTQGLMGAITTWYTTWEGRFTHMVVKGIIGQLGVTVNAIYPSLILACWLLVMGWALYQFIRPIRLPRARVNTLILGMLILFATFAGTPSRIQSLYWTTGSIPYVGGLLLLTFLAGFLVYTLRLYPDRVPFGAAVIVALVTFLAGGLSEVYVAFQTAALGLAFLGMMAFAPARYKRPALILLGIGIIASLAALLVMATAPGNAVRRAAFPSLTLPVIAWKTFYTTLAYPFIAAGHFSTIPLITAVLLPLLYGYRLDSLPIHLRFSPRKVRRLLLLSALAAFILIVACIAPAIQATSSPPAARAYVIPQFILVITAAFWGGVMGLGARHSQPRVSNRVLLMTGVFIIALLLIGPLAATRQILKDLPDYRVYAAEWDNRDQNIRAGVQRGKRAIVTDMLSVDIGSRAALDVIGPEADQSINVCAAQYYGADTIIARTRLQMGNKLE